MDGPVRIDIDRVLDLKAGKKARYVPSFLISYLKKIIHQEEINEFLASAHGRDGVDFIQAFMDYFHNNIEVHGIENLPTGRLCTFVSNHPLGAQDGLGLSYVLGKHYNGDVRFLVNDILMNIPPLRTLFIPINKTGPQARNISRQVDDAFKSNNHIIMFPAGICSRRKKGIVRDPEWKKTFIVKSVQTKRNIVPIHFEGANSNFFYRVANLNSILPVKFNFAMLFLSDEMFKNRYKTFKITIGKPIAWETFNGSKSPSQWAQYVKNIAYSL